MNINSFKTLIALTTALSLIPVTSAYADSGVFDVLDYDIGYDIENAELLAIELDVDFAILLMEIVSYDDGFVELAIPRGLIDSSFSDVEDDIFYVIIDGTESDFLELDSTDTTRTLIIPFFADDQQIEILGTNVLSSAPTAVEIPSWIKNNAGWWAEGQIGDSDFTSGIQFMIKENIIVIPDLPEQTSETTQGVPDWVRNNAGWWADGLISDDDFISGIKYLVEQGIIKI